MPTDSQACACSLSRRSPYCPLSKYALTCASARRAVFSHCPAWLIATRKIQLGPEAKQGNKPRAEKEAGLGEAKQGNKPRAEKEAGLGETKLGNKPRAEKEAGLGEAKQGNKPRAEKEAGLGETKQRNKPRAEKEAGLGETKQGNKPQKKRTIITNNEKKEKRGSPWL